MNRKFSQQIAGNMGYRLPTAFDQVWYMVFFSPWPSFFIDLKKFTTKLLHIYSKYVSIGEGRLRKGSDKRHDKVS